MPPYPYHPHGHEAVGRRFEQDFLSFEVYEDPVEVVDEDAQEVYGSGDWHNADEEEEYVNDGRRGSYEVASDNYREEEEYDHPQAYLFPHDSHADSRYIQTSVSPEQSSYSDSHTLTRYGEPYFHEYDQHQSGPDGQYLPSSSPDCYPFSGTLCEPTSSPPVQTSDTIIEPDSPRSEEWSSPPAYKLKRKADGLDEPEDDELYFEASREEKRSRLESASHVPYSAVHPHLGTYEPAGTIQNQSASATPPVSYQQQALDHPSRSAAPSPSSTPTPPATQNRKRRHEPNARETAERTLKKPFRAPAPKVVLAKAPRRHSVSPPPPPKAKAASSGKPLLFHSAPTGRHRPPSQENQVPPPSSQGAQAFFDSIKGGRASAKLPARKAFKPPLLRPLAQKQGTDAQSPACRAESTQSVLAKLEKEARSLRQAVRYHTDISEDERLLELIRQWRSAGRDVVEQIYDRVPKPDPSAETDRPGGSWFFGPGGGGGGRQEFDLTDEQERWLAHCPKNDDGEPVDEEGNTLFQPADDLMKMVEEGCKARPGESEHYVPTYQNGMSGTRPKVDVSPKEWNMGTMMLRFSVDPALLGWDEDLEDWAEVEE